MINGKLKVLSAAALIAVAGAVQAAVSQPRHVTIEYEYAKDGEIVSRKINGAVQRYEYDLRGQLTGVYDGDGSAPSEARRFLRGASPRRVRTSHPLVPSVGTMEEESNPNEVV